MTKIMNRKEKVLLLKGVATGKINPRNIYEEEKIDYSKFTGRELYELKVLFNTYGPYQKWPIKEKEKFEKIVETSKLRESLTDEEKKLPPECFAK
jgi:hypothetical protein